jgi:DNA-binding transcriptional MerR regulator
MKLNLIVPQKKGGHYIFDKECEEELQEVLELKDMGFSLQKIKKIFYFKRIGKLTSYQKNNYYQNLYKEKIYEIEKEIENLKEAKLNLKEKISDLEENNSRDKSVLGIGLDALSLFACPDCQGDLSLSAENVKNNQVLKGSLNCSCGKILKIIDGILYSNPIGESDLKIDEEFIERDHIEKYIKATEPEFMDETYQSLEWLKQNFEELELANKIILEPGSGYGYFLRQIYEFIPESAYYICIDNEPQMNKYLKSILEMTGKKSNIIFITADLPDLPLKDNLVDIMVDFTGTSGYSFQNEEFLPQQLEEYFKERIIILATFIIYDKFGPNNIVERPYRYNFMYREVKNNLINQSFEIKREHKSETKKIKKSMGKYEDFAQPGDKIYSYQLKAERWS